MMSGVADESAATSQYLDDGDDHRYMKRPRYLEGWEVCLAPTQDRKTLGLSDLFVASSAQCPVDTCSDNTVSPSTRQPTASDATGNGTSSSFFSLRLEHREGGVMARHRGEERILLFRSDRPGAIAKIIYSSTPATRTCVTKESTEEDCKEETSSCNMAQAKIHVLDVKDQYRGFDLGGLLFTEALASLCRRYLDEPEGDDNSNESSSAEEKEHDDVYHPSSIHCQLDAEEDASRYNKLVGFYEKLGCQVKPKAKVLYLNNNDGETYRKVPMQIALIAKQQTMQRKRRKAKDAGSLGLRKQGFVPVVLFEARGKRRVGIPSSENGKVYWLLIEDSEGHVEFRTTKGHYLRVSPDGHCAAAVLSEDEVVADGNEDAQNNVEFWSKFELLRVSEENDNDDSVVPNEVRAKALWVLRSASHGTFLTLDSSSHLFHCSKTPAFWQADCSGFSLTSTSDTPLRRQHYRKQWMKQTVDYAVSMRERYFGFNLKRMDLLTALDLAHKLPSYRFGVERHVKAASLRTRCFRTAELFRNAGHPDWVQLIALVYSLAGVVNLIDMETAIGSENDYDWTIPSRGRVMGCTPPASVVFGEFRSLNVDERDPRYNSLQGMYDLHCGFGNVLLTWTGPEYMYYMLKHNEVSVPDEGLKMLRLASLSDWHSNDAYGQFATDDDQDMQQFVADFDELIRAARDEARNGDEMSTAECGGLWKTHYADVAIKYGADGNLMW